MTVRFCAVGLVALASSFLAACGDDYTYVIITGEAGGSAGAGGSSSDGGSDASSGGDGGNGVSGSGGGAPTAACDPTAPFATDGPVAGLESAAEGGARLTSDELTVVFSVVTPGTGDAELYIAQRSSRSAPFGARRPLGVNTTASEMRPWLSDDRLTLVFDRVDSPTVASSEGVAFIAARATPSEDFIAEAPFVVGGGAFIVGGANGTLYYSTPGPNVVQESLANWQPTGNGTVVQTDYRPLPTRDQLTLYTSFQGIRVSQRANTNESFGSSTDVAVSGAFATWISADNCRLYFETGDGNVGIHVAERQPPP